MESLESQWNLWNLSRIFRILVESLESYNVESYWNRIKTWLKPKKGVRRDQLQSYLNEFIWKDHFGRTDPANPDRAFDEILVLISVDYPV